MVLVITRLRLVIWLNKVQNTPRNPWCSTGKRMPSFGTWSVHFPALVESGHTSASSSISSFPAPVPWSAHASATPRSGVRHSWLLVLSRCWPPSTLSVGSCQSTGDGWSFRWVSRTDKRCNSSLSRPMPAVTVRDPVDPSLALARCECTQHCLMKQNQSACVTFATSAMKVKDFL